MLALLASCSGSGSLNQPAPLSEDYRLALKVYDESFLGDRPATSFSVSAMQRGEYLDATVGVTEAGNLRALCLELDYDPSLLTPLSLERSQLLDKSLPRQDLLELTKLDRPGTVHYAHMQPLLSHGFDGSGELLTVRFRRQSMASSRLASTPPTASQSIAQLSGSIQSGELAWYYRNRGDYDQNGEVNVSDITPLGVKLGAVSATPGEAFDEALSEWMVDGDENGNINISDITPLGANLGNSASAGYNIYTSDAETDYPDSDNGNTNGPGTTLLGVAGGTPPLSDALNYAAKAAEHLRFVYTLPDPLPGKYYWVRPSDGTSDGVPSTLVGPLSLENIPKPVIENIDKIEVVVGDTLVITGTGFGIKDGADTVLLNDLSLEIISWTNTTITAKIPEGAADGPLVVSTLRDSDPSSNLNIIPPTPGQPDGNTV